MKIQVDIDLKVPRSVRNAALVVIPVVVLLATTAIVRAGVPNIFATGETLSAQQMNDNFVAVTTPPGTIVAFGSPIPPAG